MNQYHAQQEVDVTDTRAIQDFVARSDAVGEPGTVAANDFWKSVTFRLPEWLIARAAQLHPLSGEYFDLQDQLYIFIRGQPYAGARSELTQFDRSAAMEGHLAYPNRTPRELNTYLRAHAKLVDHFDIDLPGRVLEIGSGWGFSAEYIATIGHHVTAVEINPDFVEVASQRSRRRNLGIDYRVGTFEHLPLAPDERFDVAYCFEAFHHARDFRGALGKIAELLRPKGQVILFGEPFIDERMWPSWGLRLDPLSVYCIAKFGWWESGWTESFLASVFRSCGLSSTFVDEHSDLERYMIGRRSENYGAGQLSGRPEVEGWTRDRSYLVSLGDSRLEFYRRLRRVTMSLDNFSPSPLWVRLESAAMREPLTVNLTPGPNRVTVPVLPPASGARWEMRITSQTWNPRATLGQGEDRELSFHLSRLEEYSVDESTAPESV